MLNYYGLFIYLLKYFNVDSWIHVNKIVTYKTNAILGFIATGLDDFNLTIKGNVAEIA
jgi:hypothetical protein